MTGPTAWVCTGCGAAADEHGAFRDVSCFMNAVEVRLESILVGDEGLVTYAEAVSAP